MLHLCLLVRGYLCTFGVKEGLVDVVDDVANPGLLTIPLGQVLHEGRVGEEWAGVAVVDVFDDAAVEEPSHDIAFLADIAIMDPLERLVGAHELRHPLMELRCDGGRRPLSGLEVQLEVEGHHV